MKRSTQTFLALCAGPLLLAMAVSAGPNDDYQPKTSGSGDSASGDSYDGAEEVYDTAPSPVENDGMPAPNYDAPVYLYPETPAPVEEVTAEEMAEAEETPAPVEVEKTSAPTAYYMETTSEGGMEKTPTDPVYGDEEEAAPEPEEMPMENPTEGGSCSTYDEDVRSSISLWVGWRAFSVSVRCTAFSFSPLPRFVVLSAPAANGSMSFGDSLT